jgi:hypothetical protein
LSSDAESQALMALEDDLYAYARGASAIYCGRITAHGSRIFYFYATDPDTLAPSVDAAMLLHADYQHQITTQADGDWSLYARFLYPSPVEYQRIQRRRLN